MQSVRDRNRSRFGVVTILRCGGAGPAVETQEGEHSRVLGTAFRGILSGAVGGVHE